jgi:hypothetical protein
MTMILYIVLLCDVFSSSAVAVDGLESLELLDVFSDRVQTY